MSLPILNRLYTDIVERGGIHTIGTKQVGKSNLKKKLTAYVIQNHPETKVIIIDPEGSWEFDFNAVRFYRILKKSMKISEEPIGRRLNGQVFTRKVYKLDETTKADVLRLLKDKEPILFIVELENPEEIGYFSAFVIETIYDMQRIKRKYHKGKLKQKYFIVLEEAENIFDQSSLDKTIFNKLRKKYAEMANLRIGILSSSQRLTEVNKKFRAKMCGYLIGYLLEDEYIGHIQRMLRIKLGKNKAKQVTNPQFRYKFFYTALNKVIQLDRFEPQGKPQEIDRTKEPQEEPQETEEIKPMKTKKLRLRDKIKNALKFWLLPYKVTDKPKIYKQTQNNQEQTEEDQTEQDTALAVPIDMLEENED